MEGIVDVNEKFRLKKALNIDFTKKRHKRDVKSDGRDGHLMSNNGDLEFDLRQEGKIRINEMVG